jgi:hypothetical protein
MNRVNREGRYGLDSSGSEYGPVSGSCEHGNEPSGSIQGGKFPAQLRDTRTKFKIKCGEIVHHPPPQLNTHHPGSSNK